MAEKTLSRSDVIDFVESIEQLTSSLTEIALALDEHNIRCNAAKTVGNAVTVFGSDDVDRSVQEVYSEGETNGWVIPLDDFAPDGDVTANIIVIMRSNDGPTCMGAECLRTDATVAEGDVGTPENESKHGQQFFPEGPSSAVQDILSEAGATASSEAGTTTDDALFSPTWTGMLSYVKGFFASVEEETPAGEERSSADSVLLSKETTSNSDNGTSSAPSPPRADGQCEALHEETGSREKLTLAAEGACKVDSMSDNGELEDSGDDRRRSSMQTQPPGNRAGPGRMGMLSFVRGIFSDDETNTTGANSINLKTSQNDEEGNSHAVTNGHEQYSVTEEIGVLESGVKWSEGNLSETYAASEHQIVLGEPDLVNPSNALNKRLADKKESTSGMALFSYVTGLFSSDDASAINKQEPVSSENSQVGREGHSSTNKNSRSPAMELIMIDEDFVMSEPQIFYGEDNSDKEALDKNRKPSSKNVLSESGKAIPGMTNMLSYVAGLFSIGAEKATGERMATREQEPISLEPEDLINFDEDRPLEINAVTKEKAAISKSSQEVDIGFSSNSQLENVSKNFKSSLDTGKKISAVDEMLSLSSDVESMDVLILAADTFHESDKSNEASLLMSCSSLDETAPTSSCVESVDNLPLANDTLNGLEKKNTASKKLSRSSLDHVTSSYPDIETADCCNVDKNMFFMSGAVNEMSSLSSVRSEKETRALSLDYDSMEGPVHSVD